jgi:hypothetical protein
VRNSTGFVFLPNNLRQSGFSGLRMERTVLDVVRLVHAKSHGQLEARIYFLPLLKSLPMVPRASERRGTAVQIRETAVAPGCTVLATDLQRSVGR